MFIPPVKPWGQLSQGLGPSELASATAPGYTVTPYTLAKEGGMEGNSGVEYAGSLLGAEGRVLPSDIFGLHSKCVFLLQLEITNKETDASWKNKGTVKCPKI